MDDENDVNENLDFGSEFEDEHDFLPLDLLMAAFAEGERFEVADA